MNVEAVVVAYLALATIFVVKTYGEAEEKQAPWNAVRAAGLVYCLFWPILILAVVTLELSRDRSRS